jgi:EmrB/QacA subfamily drug resistance transporter
MTSVSLPDRSRWHALAVLCAAMLMIILDQTIVNVALPAIQRDLAFSQADLAWVVNAYLIAFGGLLLLAGRLGDLLGRKRIFLAGLTVFTAASLLCGFAVNQQMLIAARFVQGTGGALAAAVALGMVVTLFPEPVERAKAIGIYSFVAASGASIGLLLGGVLTRALSWHWIFFVNVPIGLAAIVLALRLLASERGIGLAASEAPGEQIGARRSPKLRGRADVLGAFAVTSGLMIGVYTIVKTTDYGWASAPTIGLGALAIALLAGFVVRQATAANPLVPLEIFRSRQVAGANFINVLTVAGLLGMFFLGVLYMQQVLGYDELQTGLAFLPVAVAIGGLSVGLSARLVTRYGSQRVMLVGLVLAGIGLSLLARLPVDGNYLVDIFPSMALLGTGMGLFFPAVVTLAMSHATEEDSGLASGLVNTSQQIGGALGLAVLATIATSRTDRLLTGGEAANAAMVGGFRLAFTISAGLVLVAAAVSAIVLRRPASQPPAPEPVASEPYEPAPATA